MQLLEIYGNSMFSFIKSHQTVFQSGCPFFFPTSNIRVIWFLNIGTNLVLTLFTYFIHCNRWHFTVILIWSVSNGISFSLLNFKSSSYILSMNPLLDMWFIIFPLVYSLTFNVFTGALGEQVF